MSNQQKLCTFFYLLTLKKNRYFFDELSVGLRPINLIYIPSSQKYDVLSTFLTDITRRAL